MPTASFLQKAAKICLPIKTIQRKFLFQVLKLQTQYCHKNTQNHNRQHMFVIKEHSKSFLSMRQKIWRKLVSRGNKTSVTQTNTHTNELKQQI